MTGDLVETCSGQAPASFISDPDQVWATRGAARATLGEVLTEAAFETMETHAERLAAGVRSVIAELGVPWHVTGLGCRAEYLFRPDRPRTGTEAAAAGNEELDSLIHLAMLNRGVLLTPFHNMALMSPATTAAQVDQHSSAFAENRRERCSGQPDRLAQEGTMEATLNPHGVARADVRHG